MVYNVEMPVEEACYLNGSQPSNCIPSGVSISEMVYYVLEASETDFNNMMKSIGVNELNYFLENSAEIEYGLASVNEAAGNNGKAKNIYDDMIKWLEKLWSGAQELIKKTLDWFAEQSSRINSQVLNGMDKKTLQKNLNTLKDDKKFGTSYEYKNITDYLSSNKIKSLVASVNSAADKFVDSATKSGAKVNALADKLDANVDTMVKKVYGEATGVSAMKKVLKNDIRGNKFTVTGKWVKEHWSTILTEAKSYPSAKKELNKAYAAVKAEYNKAVKKCKEDLNKFEHNGVFDASAFVRVNKAKKTMLNVLMCATSAIAECLTERQRSFCTIALRVAAVPSANKKVNEQAETKEKDKSTMYESTSSTVDMLNSLFTW